MKKYIIMLCIPIILGISAIAFPRPPHEWHRPYHEQVVFDLYSQVKESETLTQELKETWPELWHQLVCGHAQYCVLCQADILLALRSNDQLWADTLGECVDDDELDLCIAEIILDAEGCE